MATERQAPSYQAEALIAEDIDAYLLQHQHKSLLRFITCGSVDDGKSTLIGRLLYEAKALLDDQLGAVAGGFTRITCANSCDTAINSHCDTCNTSC